MNRLKALYRSWAIPCAGRDVYYTRHRSQWLEKIPEAGTHRRAEQLYEQLDMLQHLRQQARRELLAESQACHHRQAQTDSLPGTDSLGFGGGTDSDAPSFSQQAPTVDLQRIGARNPRQRGISLCSRASLGAILGALLFGIGLYKHELDRQRQQRVDECQIDHYGDDVVNHQSQAVIDEHQRWCEEIK
jgi:hypothetical protein